MLACQKSWRDEGEPAETSACDMQLCPRVPGGWGKDDWGQTFERDAV